MRIYNSLSRTIEDFKPLHPSEVRMYACGPTVYHHATIGNFRTYTIVDVFHRALRANGYSVRYVMNITDVGHLTGDNFGDSSIGSDRMEVAAEKEAKSVWDIAKFYTRSFLNDYTSLGLLPPQRWTKATEHILEQIELIETLEGRHFTYRTSDGVYFDTAKCPTYGQLSTLDDIKEGARVERNPEKRNPRDFALWKFSRPSEKRQMEWESPWGIGFPGWHVECSAMSMKYLGQQFDIHFGGEDLRSTHHPNEIAQSESATGRPFVRYWVHVSFLSVDHRKMAKSVGNVYSLNDVISRGFEPAALKYFYYTGHYRSPINFTWEAIEGAQNAIDHLKRFIVEGNDRSSGTVDQFAYGKFLDAINNDADTPAALSVVWGLLRNGALAHSSRIATILACDEILGFGLHGAMKNIAVVPEEVRSLLIKREKARSENDWILADDIRSQIESFGFLVRDTQYGPKVERRK